MKVLERGPGWSTQQRCTGSSSGGGGCGSILAVEENDVNYASWHDMSGDIDWSYSFVCPVCGRSNRIDDRCIPYAIQRNAEDRIKIKSLSLR